MGRPRKKAREEEEKNGNRMTSSPAATELGGTMFAHGSPATSGADVAGGVVLPEDAAPWKGDLTSELRAFQHTITSIVSDTAAAVFTDELEWLNEFELLSFFHLHDANICAAVTGFR